MVNMQLLWIEQTNQSLAVAHAVYCGGVAVAELSAVLKSAHMELFQITSLIKRTRFNGYYGNIFRSIVVCTTHGLELSS